jgi:predicted metal-dependent phosphotriesterase family hydrolase
VILAAQGVPPASTKTVETVQGPLPYTSLGITDAHNHAWIGRVPGAAVDSPILDDFNLILQELRHYHEAGGRTILDCQPGDCGRDANKLLRLSQDSQVNLIACTGFHRRKYHPPEHWLWSAQASTVGDHLLSELKDGLRETMESSRPVRAGFMKIALEESWANCPWAALEGAARAAQAVGAMVEIHTEKGQLAEKICTYFMAAGLSPHQLVVCHLDKRPDLALHRALADLGVLLEYDTFFRLKYDPVTNLWPLLEAMVQAGFANRIALATDMADAKDYHTSSGGPGLAGLPSEIRSQLRQRGFTEEQQTQLLGGNIARRLAGIP